MKRRRNLLIEVGVVLNFPLGMLGVIGLFSGQDDGLGFAVLMAFAAAYNMVAYYLLGRRIDKMQDDLEQRAGF
jgi:hypothetical protein